jgi:hypothetical protein
MTLSGQPAGHPMALPPPNIPVMQPSQGYAAPPMFPTQQTVSPQPPQGMLLYPSSQQGPPQFNLQPVPPQQALPQQAPPQQAPQFTFPPTDAALSLRISKLAEYTSRNGPAFEEQVRTKQADNQEYAFLRGGEGSSYYQWCLFCYTKGIPVDQPLQQETVPIPDPSARQPPTAHTGGMFSQQHQHPGGIPHPGGPLPAVDAQQQHSPSPSGPIPPEIASGFAEVLHVLQGSQVG